VFETKLARMFAVASLAWFVGVVMYSGMQPQPRFQYTKDEVTEAWHQKTVSRESGMPYERWIKSVWEECNKGTAGDALIRRTKLPECATNPLFRVPTDAERSQMNSTAVFLYLRQIIERNWKIVLGVGILPIVFSAIAFIWISRGR